MRSLKRIATTLMVCAGLAASASAQTEVLVTNDIAVATTWTADNYYNLQNQIYVLPGATLTIEPGTLIASTPTANGSGSLAVTKGAKIFALGTKAKPIIMTSTADVATWAFDSNLNAHAISGSWRAAANEWGNLTVMGSGYMNEDKQVGNVPTCNANNVGPMEGLTEAFPGDPRVIYGGGDDEDCSGVIKYVSIRYAGRVVGLANELNGLSLGAIGRNTIIHHIDIMNNVDDGVEVWGGCVNLRHLNIWNVGDDSLDIDQGYRGTIQFVLIVQGFSLNAAQGSGVGDNASEHDGCEDSDWQPVTTSAIANATIIGQPLSGDGATAWRDNCRMQYFNCVMMDCGERIVRFDNSDGDCGSGYGHNGTLSWANTWTTPWNAVPAHANDCVQPDIYKAQQTGNLAQITDTVFWRNLAGDAYTEAAARGVFNPANNNTVSTLSNKPIKKIKRGPQVNLQGGSLRMLPVIALDPRPDNAALSSAGSPPSNFTSTNYRGAFEPNTLPWACGWTAASQFGFMFGGGEYNSGSGPDARGACDCSQAGNGGSIGV